MLRGIKHRCETQQNILLSKLEECDIHGLFNDDNSYKIMLVRNTTAVTDKKQEFSVHAPALLFLNSQYSYEIPDFRNVNGFVCLFSRSFFGRLISDKLKELTLFSDRGNLYPLSNSQDEQVRGIFMNMLIAVNSDYIYKEDLIRNYISEIMHFALKLPDMKSFKTRIFD